MDKENSSNSSFVKIKKAVILTAGKGTRLRPLTKAISKSMLPIGYKPMVLHCLDFLKKTFSVESVLIVVSKEYALDYINFFGQGKDFGVNVFFRVQDELDGTASAINLSSDFVGSDEHFVVMYGDNILFGDVSFSSFENNEGVCFLFEADDPSRFGCVTLSNNRINSIIEKPNIPPSNLCSAGLFILPNSVFEKIGSLSVSSRGEYEFTDVLLDLANENNLLPGYVFGERFDAGTLESYKEANLLAFKLSIDEKNIDSKSNK